MLDRDLPGLSSDENFAKFSGKSLREFQPLTGGQLTDALLAKVEADMKVAPPRADIGQEPPRRTLNWLESGVLSAHGTFGQGVGGRRHQP